MKIKSIRIQNYSIHRDSNMNLAPVTLLLGPMGSGKSALFEALISFSQIARGGLDRAFGHYPYSFGATVSSGASNGTRMIFSASIESSERIVDYRISFTQQGAINHGGGLVIGSENLSINGGAVLFDRDESDKTTLFKSQEFGGGNQTVFSVLRRRVKDGIDGNNDLLDLATSISRVHKFRLEPTALSSPAPIPDSGVSVAAQGEVPRIEYDGYGLSSVLAYLSESQPEVAQRIIETCRRMDSAIEEFFFDYVGDNRVAFGIRYSDGREAVPAVRLSSGTRLFVGWVVLLETISAPCLLMLEEPENGLAPTPQEFIWEKIQESASRGCQVIVASHSPFLLVSAWNTANSDNVSILRCSVENGRGIVRPLQDVIDENGIQLRRTGGGRTDLGLRQAEQLIQAVIYP